MIVPLFMTVIFEPNKYCQSVNILEYRPEVVIDAKMCRLFHYHTQCFARHRQNFVIKVLFHVGQLLNPYWALIVCLNQVIF